MKSLITFIAITLVAPSVFAWGAKGHQTVGHIAQSQLSKSAKAALTEILGADFSLAKESTWPDEVRGIRTFDRFKPWHYADYPSVTLQSVIGKVQIPDLKEHEKAHLPLVESLLKDHPFTVVDHAAKGDAIQAMSMMRDILKSPRSTKEQKQFAVRYLVHIMGDVHMPHHIGSGEDLGANNCMVSWNGRKEMTYPKEGGGVSIVPMNFHMVWDDIIPDQRKCGTEPCSSEEYAKFLFVNYRTQIKAEAKTWVAGGDLDWTKESADYRESTYPVVKDAEGKLVEVAGKKPGRPYCKALVSTNPPEVIPAELIPDMGEAYLAEFQPKMELGVLKAGLRLGKTLNQLFPKKKKLLGSM